jgi:hypothetical protein
MWRSARRDLVKPRTYRTPAFETCKPPPRPQQGILHGVVGVLHRSEDSVAVRVELGPMHLDELPVSILAAGTGALEHSPLRRV